MSKDAVASGGVVLTTNTDDLSAGLQKASDDVRAWATRANRDGASAGGGFFAGFGGAAKGLGKAGLVGAAIGAGMATFDVAATKLGEIKTTIADIAKQGSIASAIGLTPEQFTGIAGVAKSVGEDTKEFIESLVTLGKVASEGAAGKGEVAADFFKTLNVDAKEFAALRADEQFFRFFEAVKKVEDPLARTRALMTAFGEDGGKLLLPLLSKTPDELRKMADGFKITGAEMKAATEANKAVTEATAASDKAFRDLAIASAPAVKALAEAASDLIPAIAPLAKLAGGAFQVIGIAAKSATAAIKGIGSAFSAVGEGFKRLLGGGTGTGFLAGAANIGAAAIKKAGADAAAARGQGAFAEWQARKGGEMKDGLAEAARKWEPKFSAAFEARSAEAYSLKVRNDFGAMGQDDAPKQALKEAKETNRRLGDVAKAIDRLRESWEAV